MTITAKEFLELVNARERRLEPDYGIEALDLLVGVANIIRSKKYHKIRGIYRDYCDGRCYTGLYLQYLVDGGYLETIHRSQALESECDYVITDKLAASTSVRPMLTPNDIICAKFFTFFGLPRHLITPGRTASPVHHINDLSELSHAEIHCLYLKACLKFEITSDQLLTAQ
jgi:hypothetical protein